MRVFFNLSSRSEDKTKVNSKKIYSHLEKLGCTHTYDCFEDDVKYKITDSDEEKLSSLYSTAIKALLVSDIVVLEVSTNSFTQGYILQKALELSKPVIALHQKGRYSIFVKGIKSQLLQTVEYDEYNLRELLKQSLDYATENLEQKFNVYLPQDINNYLRWVSRKKRVSKSAFVRELLREHMTVDKDYLN